MPNPLYTVLDYFTFANYICAQRAALSFPIAAVPVLGSIEMTATLTGADENFWWLEIATDEPYLYIFGPFDSKEEAEGSSGRYTGDLIEEGWKITANNTTRQGPTRPQRPPSE